MDVFDDAEEFGKRARAARGYTGLGKPKFAELMGYTGASSVTRWESGDLGKRRNSAEGRRSFALELIRKTGCPSALFDLQEERADVSDRVEDLVRQIEDLREQVQTVYATHGPQPGAEEAELEVDEEAVAQQYEPTDASSEEQARGAANE